MTQLCDRAAVAVVLTLVAAIGSAAAQDLRLPNAAERQDWTEVRALLKDKKVDPRGRQGDGATALHWAVHRGNLEIVDLLIGAGADVNAANAHGVTPLALAAENAQPTMVARLLKAGANPNAALPVQGESILMTAALAGNLEVVTMLLDRGAQVDARTARSGQTALMWAVSENHVAVTRLLIERGADVRARSATGFTPMLFAAQQGNVEIGRMLLAAGAAVNADDGGPAPLLIAINSARVPFSLFLLEQGANPNAASRDGETALHAAISIGGRKIGFDPDAAVREPSDKGKLIAALLARGADANARARRVPLRFNAGQGSDPSSRSADNFGVARSRQGATPFWVAAENADVEVMRMLLDAGADPTARTDDQTTALMIAAGLGHGGDRYERFWSGARAAESVKFLVEHGADVNARNESGFTALHGTAFVGADEAAEYLVQRGAQVNAQDFLGRTAFRIAEGHKGGGMSFVSRPATAALLAKLGADTALGPHFNETERELAAGAVGVAGTAPNPPIGPSTSR
jgi:ankyrin repeat protein